MVVGRGGGLKGVVIVIADSSSKFREFANVKLRDDVDLYASELDHLD